MGTTAQGVLTDAGAGSAWVLAGLLAWAGAAKLHRRADAVRSFARLGVPAPDVAVSAVVAAELVTALALVVVPPIGAVLALIVLGAFTAFLVARLRNGAAAPCACFGSTTAPLSWRSVLRNAALALLALSALWGSATPTLAGVVFASSVALLGGVGLATVDLVAATGRLWSLGPVDRDVAAPAGGEVVP